jgi:hypothetical protein
MTVCPQCGRQVSLWSRDLFTGVCRPCRTAGVPLVDLSYEPLPAPAQRAARRDRLVTYFVACLLCFGPMAGLWAGFWVAWGETPEGIWHPSLLLTFLGLPAWLAYREWCFRRRLRCPRCSRRLWAAAVPSPQGNFLLLCRGCKVGWDCGVPFEEPQPCGQSSGN